MPIPQKADAMSESKCQSNMHLRLMHSLRGLAKFKINQDIQKQIWIELTKFGAIHFFLETNLRHDLCGFYWFSNFLFSIQNGPGPTHSLPIFFYVWIFLPLQHP